LKNFFEPPFLPLYMAPLRPFACRSQRLCTADDTAAQLAEPALWAYSPSAKLAKAERNLGRGIGGI
jgi:hypothetical protein